MKNIFSILQPTITILFIIIACIVYGLSLVPAILFFNYINCSLSANSIFLNALCVGLGLSIGFFIFGICLVFIVGFIVRVLPIKPKPGIYPLASLDTIKWGLCCAFLRLVYLKLEFFYKFGVNI